MHATLSDVLDQASLARAVESSLLHQQGYTLEGVIFEPFATLESL
jgi:hypothetical protein